MAHFTTYTNGDPVVRSGGSNAAGFPKVTVFENTFDATRRPLASEDTVDLITIPAGTYVLKAFVHVVAPDATTTHEVNVGDAADRDGWVVETVLSANNRKMGAGAYAASTGALIGKFYEAATPISLQVKSGDTVTTARIRVVVFAVSIG
jgi:hypothetical protein